MHGGAKTRLSSSGSQYRYTMVIRPARGRAGRALLLFPFVLFSHHAGSGVGCVMYTLASQEHDGFPSAINGRKTVHGALVGKFCFFDLASFTAFIVSCQSRSDILVTQLFTFWNSMGAFSG